MEFKSLNGKISFATRQLLYAEIAEEADRIFGENYSAAMNNSEMSWSDIMHESMLDGEHIAFLKIMTAIRNIKPSEIYCIDSKEKLA